MCWTVATAMLYASASMRFRHLTNRNPHMFPDLVRQPREWKRAQPVVGPAKPWPPPSGAVLLEEINEDAIEPLNHDDPPAWDRPH